MSRVHDVLLLTALESQRERLRRCRAILKEAGVSDEKLRASTVRLRALWDADLAKGNSWPAVAVGAVQFLALSVDAGLSSAMAGQAFAGLDLWIEEQSTPRGASTHEESTVHGSEPHEEPTT